MIKQKESNQQMLLYSLNKVYRGGEFLCLLISVAVSVFVSCQTADDIYDQLEPSQIEKIPKTGLPAVIIETPNNDSINSKENWINGATISIVNPDMTLDYKGTMSIKGRGNSTWLYPKKPYTVKLDKKAKVLGMNKHKSWCLLANWMDRTLMRNAVAFEISRYTDLAWTPNGRFVEVVLNGEHIGNYYLCEQIKIDENRVNVVDHGDYSKEPQNITGGYIFEVDVNYDEIYKFRPAISNFPWMIKEPDEISEFQYNYIVSYVNEMEDALYDDKKFVDRVFADYLDLESFADWWLINELTMNWEINHPKSCYMYKDINGKITAGPVWDYDWATFVPAATHSYISKNGLYYSRLFCDPAFIALVKARWLKFKPNLESEIPVYIDNLKSQLEKSEEINTQMWPIIGTMPNGDESMSFADAVQRLKTSYLNKLNWLDRQIQMW